MKIAEQLYVYLWQDDRENNCNSVFIDGQIPLLIDPGHLRRVNVLFGKMAKDGVDPVRIKVVICTHGHPDHFEGTLAFRDPSTKIGISQQEEKYIDEIGRTMYLQMGTAMPQYRVDFYLDGGEFTVGRHQFQILRTPGHSPGSICIYWPRHKVLISGDVVFMQGVGRSDMPGGDAKELAKSVDRLSKLPVELLIPGHGPLVQGAEQVQSNFDFVKQAFLDLR